MSKSPKSEQDKYYERLNREAAEREKEHEEVLERVEKAKEEEEKRQDEAEKAWGKGD